MTRCTQTHLLLFLTLATVLLTLSSGSWVQEYVLIDNYAGADFFSNFTFQLNQYCQCEGAANFTTQDQAQRMLAA